MTKSEEQIAKLREMLIGQQNVLEHIRREMDAFQVELKELRGLAKPIEDQLRTNREEFIRLHTRFDEHVKQYEKWDSRRWTFIGLLVGSSLTLIANITVIFLRK